jgi:hypothetical protein
VERKRERGAPARLPEVNKISLLPHTKITNLIPAEWKEGESFTKLNSLGEIKLKVQT